MKRTIWLAAALVAACGSPEPRTSGSAEERAPAGTVDSILPPDEALARFRDGLTEPEALAGGERSVEALVRAWVAAVEAGDTATIRRLVIDRAEFAWLYYPESQFARRPLYQPPEILWMRMQAASEKGIVRVLRRLGGGGLGHLGVECPREPRIEGANRIREYCAVLRVVEGDTVPAVLFGGILARGGRFKFIGYGNQF